MDFLTHMRKLGSILKTSSELADDYNNPTGKGDFREIGLVDILKSKLPSNLLISKGEVMDSNGARTSEFDIVVTAESDSPRYFSLADRHVLPCEDVLMVGEVKSRYDKGQATYFIKALEKLNTLQRYYQPTKIYEKIDATAANSFRNHPVTCSESHKGIPPIAGFFFSYSSPADETIIKHLEELNPPRNFLGIYNIGQSQIIRINGKWTASPKELKDEVLFYLFFSIDQYCSAGDRNIHITADRDKYYQKFLQNQI